MADILQTSFEMNFIDTKQFVFALNVNNHVFLKAEAV